MAGWPDRACVPASVPAQVDAMAGPSAPVAVPAPVAAAASAAAPAAAAVSPDIASQVALAIRSAVVPAVDQSTGFMMHEETQAVLAAENWYEVPRATRDRIWQRFTRLWQGRRSFFFLVLGTNVPLFCACGG